jgi:hypothetical protein
VKRATWLFLEAMLAEMHERRARLEAETIELEDEGEVFEHPGEGELAAEADGSLPPQVPAAEMARYLEDLRDSEIFD